MHQPEWTRHTVLPGACVLALLTACGGSSTPSSQAIRTYQATASVGDFLSISVDPNTETIAYQNHTNGRSGTVAYTVAADGGYTITTAGGGLLKAYEIPGFALVASADNTGPQAGTTSLVTAILQAPISLGWLEGQTFNYMQWRTSQGGLGIGAVAVDPSGTVSTTGYWPYGAMQVALGAGENPSPWNSNNFSATSFTADPSGHFLTMAGDGGNDTIFATQGGFFVVDNPNGSIISVPQASSSALDPGTAGTYKALVFSNNDTMNSGSSAATSTGTVAGATLTLSSGGLLTVRDAGGSTLISQTLQPVSAVAGLMGTGHLPPCPGLFTCTATNGTVKQELYMEFINQAILFCEFSYDTAQGSSDPAYAYFYGVAMKQ